MKRISFVLILLAGCAGPPIETVHERSLEDAIEEGVEYLTSTQSPDGSWGQGKDTSDFDVLASVPGSHDAFRVGTTALCVMALRETGERSASKKGLAYLSSYDGARRANRMEIYNIWAHIYGLEALARAWKEDKVEAYKDGAMRHLKWLETYETYVGGWNYYDFVYGTEKPSMEPVSFATAAGLVALRQARDAGLPAPESLVRHALSRLREMRNPDGSFLYGSDFRYSPRHLANRGNGSLGRTQSGHYALDLWKQDGIGEKEIREGLDRLFREHRFIEIGRKRLMPHEAWYFTAGYYYYFGHYYAAKLIEGLADKSDYREQLKSVILPHQEPDGSWWDFHLYDYGKPWGTSFAIMTLLRCR
ncbi:MAG TPA: prenyltransferase/squalene oxidase repeat-containing protein [Planctomycetota bacterium]|nr:prenyltransferase/squalene oxidase repeat-containing protein [Planctomycetota bacterium]